MPRPARNDKAFFIRQMRLRARFSQKELGHASKTSERTVQRWENGRAWPNSIQWGDVLRAIHPRDRDLAVEVAAETHLSLVDLGLESPPQPIVAAKPTLAEAPSTAPTAPSPVVTPSTPEVIEPEPARHPEPTLADLARIPLCKAAEVAGLSPSVLRPVLKEALVSMRELGLSITDVIAGLSK